MANTFITAERVVPYASALTYESGLLAGIVNRQVGVGEAAWGSSVTVSVPAKLTARTRKPDAREAIQTDDLTERKFSITLDEQVYSAVPVGDFERTFNIEDFAARVVAPQADAVADHIEKRVARAITAATTTLTKPGKSNLEHVTQLRAQLRGKGLPAANLVLLAGVGAYAALLETTPLQRVDASGDTLALREAQVGQLRGFTVVESHELPEMDLYAMHRDAVILATKAPTPPAGAASAAAGAVGGVEVLYVRDYDSTILHDRSIIQTFAGVGYAPLRDKTGAVLPEGGIIKHTIA